MRTGLASFQPRCSISSWVSDEALSWGSLGLTGRTWRKGQYRNIQLIFPGRSLYHFYSIISTVVKESKYMTPGRKRRSLFVFAVLHLSYYLCSSGREFTGRMSGVLYRGRILGYYPCSYNVDNTLMEIELVFSTPSFVTWGRSHMINRSKLITLLDSSSFYSLLTQSITLFSISPTLLFPQTQTNILATMKLSLKLVATLAALTTAAVALGKPRLDYCESNSSIEKVDDGSYSVRFGGRERLFPSTRRDRSWWVKSHATRYHKAELKTPGPTVEPTSSPSVLRGIGHGKSHTYFQRWPSTLTPSKMSLWPLEVHNLDRRTLLLWRWVSPSRTSATSLVLVSTMKSTRLCNICVPKTANHAKRKDTRSMSTSQTVNTSIMARVHSPSHSPDSTM